MIHYDRDYYDYIVVIVIYRRCYYYCRVGFIPRPAAPPLIPIDNGAHVPELGDVHDCWSPGGAGPAIIRRREGLGRGDRSIRPIPNLVPCPTGWYTVLTHNSRGCVLPSFPFWIPRWYDRTGAQLFWRRDGLSSAALVFFFFFYCRASVMSVWIDYYRKRPRSQSIRSPWATHA